MSQDLITRLAAADSSSLSDADKGLRVMDSGLRPLSVGLRLTGRAFTVSAHDTLLSMFEAFTQAQAGDVLVVETAGSPRAVAGELFAAEAKRMGLAGVVIDGFCRDIAGIRELELPFYARGATPRAAPAEGEPRVGMPVQVGGVEVAAGDLLVGDEDGIVVGSEAEIEAALSLMEGIQEAEGAILASVRSGTSLLDKVLYAEHLARLRAGESSKLEFKP